MKLESVELKPLFSKINFENELKEKTFTTKPKN